MDKLIACCGLDCSACEARIATLADDNALRAQIAETWRVQYNVPGIVPEMINCTGCMEEGVKIGHCYECQVRNCVISRGYKTCADCAQLDSCKIVSQIHQFSPIALENLKSLH